MIERQIITKPRLAFVGVGWIGRNRMEAAAKSGLGDIVAISDPSAKCIAEAKKICSSGNTYTNYEDLLHDAAVDAVVIATPSALHMPQAIQAIKNNKAVFCQKPLGRNAREVGAVLEAAHEADLLLGADFSYRYTKAFRKILDVIRSGELGNIFAAELKFHNAYGPGKPWFYDINEAGGGCVLDLGVHLIDLLLYAFEFPTVTRIGSQLYAKGLRVQSGSVVEDYADVTMTLENDAHAHLSCSWNLQAGTEAVIEVNFYGTHGGVAMRNINGSFYDFEARRFWGTRSEVLIDGPDDWGGRAIIHWLERLNRSKHFDDQANNYLASAHVIDMIYGKE